MKIPLAYNVRNLMVRKMTTCMTALGTALSVAVLLAVLSMVAGLRTAFVLTGRPDHLLVLRKGSSAELTSVITRGDYQDILCRPGIAVGEDGRPMASLEIVTVIDVESPGIDQMNVNLRGLLPLGFKMRPQLQMIAGRMFTPGRREVVVGKAVADAHPAARIGQKLHFGRGEWEVVGIFDGGRSAFDSEVFTDLNQIAADFERMGFLSSVLVRAQPGWFDSLRKGMEDDRRLNVTPVPEVEYYASQTQSAIPIQVMGAIIAVIMAVGSAFAAMNTMYASVVRRSAEIGTLRVLGFSRGSILLSFFLESLLLAALGGLIGCVLVLPLNGVKTSVGSFTTFSEMVFQLHVSLPLLVGGLVFALLIGAAGGMLPASNAARKEILAALRG